MNPNASPEEKANVLLVDDRPLNLVALHACLDPLEQNLVDASSGREALRRLEERDFAVILMDVHMPALDGFETARLVRKRERSRETPIIFLTAVFQNQQEILRGYALGAVDYMFYPFTPEVLRWKVAAFVELYNSRRALERQLQQTQRLNQELTRSSALLKKRNEQLDTLNQELEAFSRSVSHDLRAPLRHIGGYARMLEERAAAALDEKGRACLGHISDSARQMNLLVELLLSFSRAGRQALHASQVALAPLVEEIVRELEPDTEGRRIDWQIGALPEARADPELLKMALANLVSNAIKYTRERQEARIEIGARVEASEIVVWVRDNGVGFDPAQAGRLFEPFERLHSVSEFEGAGLGLASVRRIIQRHGGRVWAEGVPDAGATFYFSIPAETGHGPVLRDADDRQDQHPPAR